MEPGAALRARISYSLDIATPELTLETTAASLEDVLSAVRAWLGAYRSSVETTPAGPADR